VSYHSFAGAASITPSEISADAATLNNIRLWDPSNNISLESVTRRQSVRSYYSFASLSVDRYYINESSPGSHRRPPTRQFQLASNSWVNQHLQYTTASEPPSSRPTRLIHDGNPTLSSPTSASVDNGMPL